MARPAAQAKTHNGFDPDVVQGYVGRIENLKADIATMRGKFMAEVKEVHGDITEIYNEAKENAGLTRKSLGRAIKAREMAKKIEKLRDGMGEDEVDNYDKIMLALGGLSDLPLGQAVLEKAERRGRNGRGRAAAAAAAAAGESGEHVE